MLCAGQASIFQSTFSFLEQVCDVTGGVGSCVNGKLLRMQMFVIMYTQKEARERGKDRKDKVENGTRALDALCVWGGDYIPSGERTVPLLEIGDKDVLTPLRVKMYLKEY